MAIAIKCVCGRSILEQETRCKHCGTSQEGVIIHQLVKFSALMVEKLENYVKNTLARLRIMDDLLHNR